MFVKLSCRPSALLEEAEAPRNSQFEIVLGVGDPLSMRAAWAPPNAEFCRNVHCCSTTWSYTPVASPPPRWSVPAVLPDSRQPVMVSTPPENQTPPPSPLAR